MAADAAQAERALERFDTAAERLAGSEAINLGGLAAILLRTESASSSQIEGITVGAKNLALSTLEEASTHNARLVTNNVRAMFGALALADQLDQDAILAMHRELMMHSRPE
ncbi:MAG TPA: Fic family protein, partial [Candidatus Agrococcus pullicola]|nr:Fic family protein [Candidatus Agrococcus pullicola]